jgi:hypothetical protein
VFQAPHGAGKHAGAGYIGGPEKLVFQLNRDLIRPLKTNNLLYEVEIDDIINKKEGHISDYIILLKTIGRFLRWNVNRLSILSKLNTRNG